MLPPAFQLLDLSGPILRLHQVNSGVAERLAQIEIQRTSNSEAEWIQELMPAIGGFWEQFKGTVVALLPCRLMLSKVIRIPNVEAAQQDQLIRHEMEEAFPHGSDELVWSRIQLSADHIESSFVVFALRHQLYETLNAELKKLGVKKVYLIPAVALEFLHAAENRDLSQPFHLLYFEADAGLWLAVGPTEAYSKSLRPNLTGDDASERAPWQSEIRKARATLKRQFSGWTEAGAVISTKTEFEDSWLPEFHSIIEVEDDIRLLNPEDSTQRHLTQIDALSAKKSTAFDPLIFALFERGESARRLRWWILAGAALVALSPYPLWLANAEIASDYRDQARSVQLEARRKNEVRIQWDSLVKEMENLSAELNLLKRDQALMDGWIGLFTDLQGAMIEVEDIWLDDMEASIEGEGKNASLNIDGRFLVRQMNRDDSVRTDVIRDTRDRLKKLQDLFTGSKYVKSLENFGVSYEGIEQGINVVAFSVEILLGDPFTMPELLVGSGEEGSS